MLHINDLEERFMEGGMGVSHMKEPSQQHTSEMFVKVQNEEPRSSKRKGSSRWLSLSETDG